MKCFNGWVRRMGTTDGYDGWFGEHVDVTGMSNGRVESRVRYMWIYRTRRYGRTREIWK